MLEEIFFAKTLDEIKVMAVKKFDVSENEIKFQILEEPKRGIFGRVKGEYKVKATYVQSIDEKPIETETIQQVVENPVEVVETVETSVETINETPVEKDEPIIEPDEPKEIEVEETQVVETVETVEPSEIVEENEGNELIPTPEELLEKSKVARDYVCRILEKMGISTENEIIQTENGVIIDFKGDGTGTIIGKRGETLDALQYLSAMICNKNEKNYYRITLDSCGYRAKRKVILQELAHKVSKSVLRTGRSQALEPMNPYERRIIHATISEIDGVVSHSVGEEPFRKVIISSENPAPKRYNNRYQKGNYRGNSNNKRGGRGNNNRGGNNKYRGNGKKKSYQPRSLDLKTSFEKDYRKPKPEDNINTGLYGKIEL